MYILKILLKIGEKTIYNEILTTNMEHIFLNIFLLYIWFNTDTYVWFFKKKDFFNYKQELGIDINYSDYLFIKNPSLFNRMLSCKPCLLFWFNISTSLLFGFDLFFTTYVLSFFIYKLLCKV